MYGVSALTTLFRLRWTNTPQLRPLPPNITRQFITNPRAPHLQLELLTSIPPTSTPTPPPPPILFLHGGFGSAGVYIPFMAALSSTTQTFALSCRGHGGSSSLSYARMVYGTTIADLASDAVAAVRYVLETTGRVPLLVGHSSGGGLAQYVLANALLGANKVPGLVLLGAVPHLGNWGVYANWAGHDPWFALRMLLHLNHVASPLSTLDLVRGAFFGDGGKGGALRDEEVEEFVRWMPPFESLWWPLQMFGSFWAWLMGRPRWLSVRDILKEMEVGEGEGEKVCVIVGDQDVLMDVGMCRRAANEYRDGIAGMRTSEKVGSRATEQEVERVDGAVVERGSGVKLVVVEGAGHHVQNDMQWKFAAEEVRKFVVQL